MAWCGKVSEGAEGALEKLLRKVSDKLDGIVRPHVEKAGGRRNITLASTDGGRLSLSLPSRWLQGHSRSNHTGSTCRKHES